MQEQKKVELIKNDGTKTTIDLVSLFTITDNNTKNDYILLTANEVDQNGLIKIMAAKVINGKLEKITDQGEWTLVKNAMRSIISSSKGNFQYQNMGDISLSYVVTDNFARIIAVQESAKMQLIKDYEEKKPAPHVVEKEEPVAPSNPNDIIYPKDDSVSSDNEVSPGISETGLNNEPIVPEKNDFSIEKSVDNEKHDVSQDLKNTNPVPEKSEFVSNVENAPLKTIVDDIKNSEDTQRDTAKEKLINAIEKAVDEYIDSIKEEKSESLEIKALKTNINVMQDELNKITKALNTQE